LPDEPPRRASPLVRLLRPLPRPAARLLSGLVLVAWVAQMAVLVRRAWSSSPVALAADLAQYGSSPVAGHLLPRRQDRLLGRPDDADRGRYEIREDGRLQMSLLGATSSVRLSSRPSWTAPST